MIYSTVNSNLVQGTKGLEKTNIKAILEILKNKKQCFEWFLENMNTLNDQEFLLWHKRFFLVHMGDIRDKYYNEKFNWPVASLVKVDDVTKRFYKNEFLGEYYKCEYSIIHDIEFELEDREYKKEELIELQKQGKIIIEQTGLAYGKELSKEELRGKTFGVCVEPFELSRDYVVKTIRQEMTTYEIKQAHSLYNKYYNKYLELIKQKIKQNQQKYNKEK